MARKSILQKIPDLIFFLGVPLTSIFWIDLFEPFVFPKFILLALIGAMSLPVIILNIPKFTSRIQYIYFGLCFLLILLLVNSLVISDVKQIALFGVQGRNMGFISYFSLILIMLVLALNKDENLNLSLMKYFAISAGVVVIYGFIQILGLDPFDWVIQFEGILGPFGNPNFMSTFSALSAIAFTTLAKQYFHIKKLFSILIFLLGISVLCIYYSGSIQGWLVLLIGLAPNISNYRNFKKFKNFLIWIIFAFALLIFILNSRLGKILMEQFKSATSAEIRFDFWQIAGRMVLDYPLTGIGIERFQYYFREYRTLAEANAFGAGTFSDSAHNIYLNLAATMGVPVALTYFSINIFTLYFFFKILSAKSNRSTTWKPLFGIWLGLQFQSLISVDYPAMLFWSHAISGVVAGFFIHSRQEAHVVKKSKANESRYKDPLSYISGIVMIIFLIPSISAQFELRKTFYALVDVRDLSQVETKSTLFRNIEKKVPNNPELPLLAANSLLQDGAFSAAELAAKRAISIDSHDYRSWWLLSSSLELQDKDFEAKAAREKAIDLSPYSLDDLLSLAKIVSKIGNRMDLESVILRIEAIDTNSPQAAEARGLID